MIKKIKVILIRQSCLLFVVLCITAAISVNAYALTFNDTYSDITSTSSQTVNLINYANSYDTFLRSDFVVFCDQQYSYYIVWGNLTNTDGIVTGSDIEYIRYHRSGTNNSYTYEYGTDTGFSLRTSHLVTSNIDELGFTSANYESYLYQDNLTYLFILIGSFLFVIMLTALRGCRS